MAKELIVVGGPNGAGKTTFADEFVARRGYTYLGADLIAYELAPHDVDSVQVEAAREFIRRFEEYVARGESFVVESTLSGKSLAQRMKKAKAAGYDISVVFIFIDSADTSLNRVRARVFKGGHNVPEADIRRRFSGRRRTSGISTVKLPTSGASGTTELTVAST